jgi:FMN phosphatase YigB (HAD superfamily)
MLKAILFDLDNTLVLFNENTFYRGYLSRIQALFADILPPEKFLERLMTATRALVQNDGDMTNAEYFINVFAKGLKGSKDKLWQRFMQFYEFEYDKLKIEVALPGKLHRTMAAIAETDLKLVLASNPLFPLEVQMKRLAWAGLDFISFAMVTHLGNMSYCKPRVEYYREICQKIDEAPENCLMVGNDPVNDMTGAIIGLKTYLTDDSKDDYLVTDRKMKVLERLKITEIPEPDFTGPLSKVPDVIRCLSAPPEIPPDGLAGSS